MIEAQQSLLASLVLDADQQINIIDRINSDDFTTIGNKNIFDACLSMINQNKEIDVFSVADITGDLALVTDIVTNSHRMNVSAAIDVVKRESGKRKALSNLEKATQDVLAANTVDAQLEALERVTDGIEIDEAEFSTLSEIMKRALERFKQRLDGKADEGIKTGFASVDDRVGGLVAGNMIVVGGRPSMGKTTYAMNIAENASDAGHRVLVFSMEMSEDELADRMIASASEISNSILRKPSYEEGSFDNEKHAKLTVGMQKVQKRKDTMCIVDKPALHIDHLRNIARKFHRTSPLELIVIDYLQLMRASEANRFEEISAISRGIKALAKELNIPIIVLSQLSREVDKRADSRPINSDLRESGQIEQDADIIQFLYRDEVYNDKDSNPNKGLAEVITRKFRNGEIGTDYLESKLWCSKFANTTRSHVEAENEKPYSYSYKK